MRQRRDLGRKPQVREHFGDVRFPGTRTHEPGPESVRLTELEANVIGGLGKTRGHGALGPQIVDFLLIGIGWRRTAAQMPQRIFDALALRFYPFLALVHARVGIEVHGLVDDRQVVLVVQIPFVGRDLGIDLDPELHVRLERRGARNLICGGRDRTGHGQQTDGHEHGPKYGREQTRTPHGGRFSTPTRRRERAKVTVLSVQFLGDRLVRRDLSRRRQSYRTTQGCASSLSLSRCNDCCMAVRAPCHSASEAPEAR